jgi:hypothetical protein
MGSSMKINHNPDEQAYLKQPTFEKEESMKDLAQGKDVQS